MLAVLLPTLALAQAVPDRHNFETLHKQVEDLVGAFKAQRQDSLVMIGRIEGPYADLMDRALQEALLKNGIQRANTRQEVEDLRETYKKQGVDVYKDRSFQKALRASRKARLTVELENACETLEDETGTRQSCILWMHGKLPTSLAFSEHRGYVLEKPRPPSPYENYRLFLYLLLAYAFIPVLLHRLDIALRKADGSWISYFSAPVHLLGNRFVVVIAVGSFVWIGPVFWEMWMTPLEGGVEAATRNIATAAGIAVVLNFFGALVVALWRDGKHGLGFFGTFGELCVLHPAFWTRRVEGKVPGAP